jgi:chromate reductase, NAD(P)H dehydrogenase (quinone)
MIAIIVGTNRKNSNSALIAALYQNILKNKGAESEIIDLSELPPDFIFTALYENTGKNLQFNLFREKVKEYEKFVFIVPEYNHSFPGVLKAFIDGLDYPTTFINKIGALVGHSAGMHGASLALSHLTDILNYLGMNIMALKPKLARIDSFIEDGKINNPLYNELLESQAEKLINF